MTLANKLTLLRLALIPVFMVAMAIPHFASRLAALLLFIGASLTDLYDGKLARRTGTVTRIGTYLDPLADKLLIAAALIVFMEFRQLHVPAWMVVFIIGREFLITGLRSLAASRGLVMAAENAGKIKTAAQMTAIITILVILTVEAAADRWPLAFLSLPRPAFFALAQFLRIAPFVLLFIATVVTLISGAFYLMKYQKLLREEFAMQKPDVAA